MNGSYQLPNFTKNRETEVTRLKSQVELFFDKEFDLYKKIGLKDGMDIIECGSGPGFLIGSILKKFPSCNAVALEIDPYLFSVLNENSNENGKQIYRAVNESIYSTGLPDEGFDFVITRLVIEHLEAPLKAMFELHRILRPGGKLVIVSNDFSYHLLTWPVIPELDEMYSAYCKSRFSEGGNPLIGRQLPVYLENSAFSKIDFAIVSANSKISGDEVFLKAENVNISKSLVESGFLDRNTLASLVEKWFAMLKDPHHVFYRQLFIVSGEKAGKTEPGLYSENLENELKGKTKKDFTGETSNLADAQREKFNNLMKRFQPVIPGNNASSATGAEAQNNSVHSTDIKKDTGKYEGSGLSDLNNIESILLLLWKQTLKNELITKDDNYFDLGGDSVLIPEIVEKLATDYNIKLRILDLFDNPSVRTLSDYIRKNNL
jgi:ubiquinone/menaquinone biosynthesis C-methylase UbiE/acyl carrier protein